MFDFTTTGITRGGIVFCTLFYFIIMIKYWNQCATIKSGRTKQPILLFILVGIFAIFSWTNGDWFHYQHFMSIAVPKQLQTGMENFYEDLIFFVNRNYFLFRTIVWGSALSLLIISFTTLRIDAGCAVYLLLAVFINYFDYSRSALGISVYFAGIPLLLSTNAVKYRVLGIALVLASSMFHRSAIVLTFLTLIAFVPINKKTVFLIIIAIAFSFYALKEYFQSFMMGLINSGGELSSKAAFYMGQERESIVSGTLIGMIIGFWKYTVFYAYMVLISYNMFKHNNYKKAPIAIRAIYNILFGLFVFAILMYFFNLGHMAFYYRFLSMTYVPLIILAVYQLKNGFMSPKTYVALLLFGSGYLSFDFLYRCAIGA